MKKIERNFEPPKGYEIDLEKTDLKQNKLIFKEKGLSIEDVNKALFGSNIYYIDDDGSIHKSAIDEIDNVINERNNATSKEQLDSLLELNVLMNVAKFVNEGWKPKDGINRWFFEFGANRESISIAKTVGIYSDVYFKDNEAIEKACHILGDERIIKALTLNH